MDTITIKVTETITTTYELEADDMDGHARLAAWRASGDADGLAEHLEGGYTYTDYAVIEREIVEG